MHAGGEEGVRGAESLPGCHACAQPGVKHPGESIDLTPPRLYKHLNRTSLSKRIPSVMLAMALLSRALFRATISPVDVGA